MPFYLLTLSTALAWEANKDTLGNEMRWLQTPIKFVLNTDGKHELDPSKIEDIVRETAAAWDCSKYGGYLSFEYDGTTKVTDVSAYDDAHAISFVDTWVDPPELLALTYVFSGEDGEIKHFDMHINSHFYTWSLDGANGTHDLQNMLAHEFGHALGLGHSEEIEATMAPTAPPGETSKRDLHNDDIQGFVYLYGGQAPNDEEGPPSFGCSSIPSEDAQTDNDSEDASSGGGSFGGGGPNAPANSGGTFMPIENSGCSAMMGQQYWLFMLGLPLLGLRRKKADA
ncbi:MAG: matrixin family metalloprotease [Myxococcota bacterium]